MSKRKITPPQKDPAQQRLDEFLAQAKSVDLQNQVAKLNDLFASCAASGDSRGAATISGELRRLNEAIQESLFSSGLVVSAGALSDYATKLCELVLSLMRPWETVLLGLDNLAIKLKRLDLRSLSEADREFVRDVIGGCEALADYGADPVIDVQLAVADLLTAVSNRPGESYETLLREYARLKRLKPDS